RATQAHSPAWASDGGQLVFTKQDAAEAQLVAWDRTTGLTRTVITSTDPRLAPPAETGFPRLTGQWAGGTDQLLVVYGWNQNPGAERAGVLSADGGKLEALPRAEPGAALIPDSLSADGQFWSVMTLTGVHAGAAIYSAAVGRLLQFIPDMRPAAWSKT